MAHSPQPLRLWPGVVIVAVQWLLRFVVPVIAPETDLVPFTLVGAVAGLIGMVAVIVWWLFFSRARWTDRVGIVVLIPIVLFVTLRTVDASIAGGAQGILLFIFVAPVLSLALVASAALTRRLTDPPRRAVMATSIVLACALWTLVRSEGVVGSKLADLKWRWTPTAEERLLAQGGDEPDPAAIATIESAPGSASAPPPAAPPADTSKEPLPGETTPPPLATPTEWPGFRGPNRDGVIGGVQIKTDWSASPPVEMWRRPIGPGWSSFAVRGDLLYTQEQRGDEEIVACYRVSTGEPVWRHRDSVRFWESNGGAGPRATPTLSNGRVYAFGATGLLNALDASTGKIAWSRNVAAETGREVPIWGFTSSPLLVDDIVIVAAEGTLAGYDAATGTPRWRGPSHGGSYSSPHRVTIDGVHQVLLLGGPGAIGVTPATGEVLWQHEWSSSPIVQPAMTADGDVVINAIASTGGVGTRRLHVSRASGGWRVEERWTSNGLKPYFNDFVVHKGYAYGFDNNILASINLADGKRAWKGGRYGQGQLVLLADQDLLLVLSEEGELALVRATPDQFKEIARFQALDDKTWNHPVLVGDVLLVRNGEEMAAFRLALASR